MSLARPDHSDRNNSSSSRSSSFLFNYESLTNFSDDSSYSSSSSSSRLPRSPGTSSSPAIFGLQDFDLNNLVLMLQRLKRPPIKAICIVSVIFIWLMGYRYTAGGLSPDVIEQSFGTTKTYTTPTKIDPLNRYRVPKVTQLPQRQEQVIPNITNWICNATARLPNTVYRVVLQTEPVLPSARRQLYDGFSSYQHQTILDKAGKERAIEAHRNTQFQMVDGCWSFSNVPRIVHPKPPILQADQVMFGVASSKDRLIQPNSITSYWLTNSSTNFYVHVPHGDVGDAESKILEYHNKTGLASVRAEREFFDVDQTMQYSRLSASMYELTMREKMQHVKWFVHLDDDTLITSVTDYLRMLDQYDANEPVYVGAHSEAMSAMWRDGRGAWGGASIAVSWPLAQQLSEKWTECDKEGRMSHTPYGDHKLDACVAYVQGRTKQQPDMRLENSLHQLDFWGSVDGILRSGVKWLTLHHFGWVNLFPYPDGFGGTPAKVLKIVNSAKVLGADGLFSNFLLKHDGGGATVLTNGYAITQYVGSMSREELERVERTYQDDRPGDYDGAVGPTREQKREGSEKKTFFVHDVVPRIIDGHQVGTTWTYRRDDGAGIEDIIVDWVL